MSFVEVNAGTSFGVFGPWNTAEIAELSTAAAAIRISLLRNGEEGRKVN
jgi:hypothetical protein